MKLKKARRGPLDTGLSLLASIHHFSSLSGGGGVSSLLGDGCLLSFFFSIREDDSNTASGHQNIHKLVPIPANEEGESGDGQAVSCGFGLCERPGEGGSQASSDPTQL